MFASRRARIGAECGPEVRSVLVKGVEVVKLGKPIGGRLGCRCGGNGGKGGRGGRRLGGENADGRCAEVKADGEGARAYSMC